MKGLWGDFWIRTVIAAMLMILAYLLSIVLIFLMYFMPRSSSGVLDFAGGAVISVNTPLPFLCVLPFWIIAEVSAKQPGRIPALGSYVLFIIAFTGLILFEPMVLVPTSHAANLIIAAPSVVMFIRVAGLMVSGMAATVPAWIYDRYNRRKSK